MNYFMKTYHCTLYYAIVWVTFVGENNLTVSILSTAHFILRYIALYNWQFLTEINGFTKTHGISFYHVINFGLHLRKVICSS